MLGLSLPIDIPWKRLAVSSDLIARPGTGPLRRWRSSLALYGYEPPAESQIYPDMTVSYLKLVASVTGFQPNPDEVGLQDRRAYQAWTDSTVAAFYEEVASKYYGCFGAILEVSVLPKGTPEELRSLALSDYPYFADFEPKKRELYEIVSETGEMMSRSLDTVNVRKGTTTSDSREVLDVFGGASVAAKGEGGEGSVSVSGQWGTRDMSQEGYENVRTTDSGREARESFSHTTQLTQMYHQLDSYHLGTNRAVFYLLPRPHVVQTEKTFVNGPRVLEGIQEFFLVVMRPKSIRELVVEARIETAHLAAEPLLEYETSTSQLALHMQLKAPKPTDAPIRDDSLVIASPPQSETFTPPEGWEIDIDPVASGHRPTQRPEQRPEQRPTDSDERRTGPGYRIDFQDGTGVRSLLIDAQKDHVTATGVIEARFVDNFPINRSIDGRLDLLATVFTRKKTPNVTAYKQALWLTGHGISSAGNDATNASRDYITFEAELHDAPAQPIGARAMTITDANRIRASVVGQLRASINHPLRYPPGAVRFSEATFIANTIASLIRRPGHADNIALANLPHLDPALKKQLQSVAPNLTRGQLMSMYPQEIADRLGLSMDQASKLRRTALGLEGPAPAPKDRWKHKVQRFGTPSIPVKATPGEHHRPQRPSPKSSG